MTSAPTRPHRPGVADGGGPAVVVADLGPPAPVSSDPEPAMAAVEGLLVSRLDALAEQWHALGPGPDPVLGDDDLPGLLAGLVLGGGKRLRPLVAHWGWVAAGGAARGTDPAPVHAVGAALELLHAFGLAQDDVMDGSTLRRGRPAVHVRAADRHREVGGRDDAERYGESTAVLVGDLAHAEADALVAELAPQVRGLWRLTSLELVRGQARDLSGAARADTVGALDRAREVAHAKSGAYTVQRPLQLGATVAGAEPGLLDLLAEHGRLVGEAFALRDDLLGVFGDPEVTGKPDADDLRSAKATVLLALVEERADGAAAAAVARMRAHQHDDADTDVVRRAMLDLGVRDDVEVRLDAVLTQAVAQLDPRVVHPDAVQGLTALAGQVAWRTS